MADKSEFVDMIREATRQVRRRIVRRAVESDGKRNHASVTAPIAWISGGRRRSRPGS